MLSFNVFKSFCGYKIVQAFADPCHIGEKACKNTKYTGHLHIFCVKQLLHYIFAEGSESPMRGPHEVAYKAN